MLFFVYTLFVLAIIYALKTFHTLCMLYIAMFYIIYSICPIYALYTYALYNIYAFNTLFDAQCKL